MQKELIYVKVNRILTVLLCTLALVCGVCAGLLSAQNNNDSGVIAEEFKTQAQPVAEEEKKENFVAQREVISSDKYMVCLTDTQFCIYKISADGTSQLVEATDFSSPIESAELSRFYPGVYVDTLQEARELIEDYIS